MNHLRMFVTNFGMMVSALFVGGCASFQAESFWGPAHKLSGLGATYAWKQGATCEADADKAGNPDIGATVQELVDADLTKLGYRRLTEGTPDFSLCYRLGKVVAQAETGLASWDDAILEVDLTDPPTGGRVWRGRVRGRIDYAAAPDARKARMATAVRQLLQPLPKAASR